MQLVAIVEHGEAHQGYRVDSSHNMRQSVKHWPRRCSADVPSVRPAGWARAPLTVLSGLTPHIPAAD
jgi:hypothetical protein